MPGGWQAVDDALTRVTGGGDIITIDQFTNFELALEWQVAPGGNSGIMFRVTEAADATYLTGPEMQVLDNAGHPDGAEPSHLCRGLLRPVPAVVERRPARRLVERSPDDRERHARRALAERREDR